jgi:membrane protease YdiL (CAAX protease family)
VIAGGLLMVVLAAVAWFLRARPAPRDRPARYRQWMVRAGTAFLLTTISCLVLLGRVDALWRMPDEFDPLHAWLPEMGWADVAGGAIGGVLIGSAVAAWRARRGGRPLGRPGAMMPRHRGELGWGAAVAIVAGATEEPFFRLLVPLLGTLATGSAPAGCVGAALLFGAMHRYQGWRGMIATTIFGLVMTGVYLVSGALWLVVLLHILVDLNALVIWPAFHRLRIGA